MNDIFTRHQKKIALNTLKMSDAGARIMGGMGKAEAIRLLLSIGYSKEKIIKLLQGYGYSESEIQSIF